MNLRFGIALALTAASALAECIPSSLSNSTFGYTFLSNDTIFTIATKTGRGACDIARFNRMADAELLNTGAILAIPPQTCHPDSTTCLLTKEPTDAICVLGGPHTYTTFPNDTIAKVALTKFHITVEALLNTTGDMLASTDPHAVIPAGSTLKLPQCSPSSCSISPYEFSYGVYKDLSKNLGATVGQIMALNPQYNYSTGAVEGAPLITLPSACKLSGGGFQVVS